MTRKKAVMAHLETWSQKLSKTTKILRQYRILPEYEAELYSFGSALSIPRVQHLVVLETKRIERKQIIQLPDQSTAR